MSDTPVTPWPDLPEPARQPDDVVGVVVHGPDGASIDADLILPGVASIRAGSLGGVSVSEWGPTGELIPRPDAYASQWSDGVISSSDMPGSGPNPSRPAQT